MIWFCWFWQQIKNKIWEPAIVLSKAHGWQQISKAKFSKIYLGKENKSLLHFHRIANHLENMNLQEEKSEDHMHRLQEYDGPGEKIYHTSRR